MNISGNALSSTFAGGIYTDNVRDLTNTSNIELNQTTIDLQAQNVLVNGVPLQPGGGGIVTDPLNSNLSIGVFDITNLPGGQTIRSISNLTIATEEKTVNIESATFPISTTMNGILRIPTIATNLITDPLESSSINMTTGGINMTSTDININGNSTITGILKTNIKLIVPQIIEESKTSSILMEASGISITSPALMYNSNAIISATGNQNQYIMGDGSLLQYSANSGNSNFYLYKSHSNTPGTPPDPGFVVYNNSTQGSATVIYISHLTDDAIDIEIFFNNINQINDVYLQDRNDSTNYIKYNITGTPTIVVGSYISIPVSLIVASGTGAISFGVNHNILLSFFTNNIEVDTRLSSLETKTQYQTGLGGGITGFTGNLLVTSEMQSGTIRKTGGLTSQFLKANGDVDSNTYVQGITTQINSSVSYINNIGKVSSNVSNLYVQLGENTIQSAITAIGVGYNIQCSSGGSTENIILNKQNYTLCGANCPPFAQTTQINGNVTIGDVSVLSTRIRMKDLKIVGNLTFVSSVNNELRTFIDNCDFSGTITFPTVAGQFAFYSITFTGCNFTTANPIVIPDQNTYRLTFSKCIFFGQTITNNLTLANSSNLFFESCSGLSTLSLGNCAKVGNLITQAGVITQFSSNLSLSGTSSQFVKYDGSADSNTYAKIQAYSVPVQVSGITETSISASVTKGSWTWADSAIGSLKIIRVTGTYQRSAAVSNTYTFRIKAGGLTVISFVTAPSPATILIPTPFITYELQFELRRVSNTQVEMTSKYENIETQTTPNIINRNYNSSTTNVPVIGASTLWSLTCQGTSATGAIFCVAIITSIMD